LTLDNDSYMHIDIVKSFLKMLNDLNQNVIKTLKIYIMIISQFIKI